MNFEEIFDCFFDSKDNLKVLHVASCDEALTPNSAPKMLIDVVKPSTVYFIEYNHTNTYANILKNPKLSMSFMDDVEFQGYRLTGSCSILSSGEEFDKAKARWNKRLVTYEADRMLKRITGQHSAKHAENALPQDFVIVKFSAEEASAVKPDRILRASSPRP